MKKNNLKLISIYFPKSSKNIWYRNIQIRDNKNVEELLIISGFYIDFPAFNPWIYGVGIFGKIVSQDYIPRNLDRIEIYRPLNNTASSLRKIRTKKPGLLPNHLGK